MYADSVKPRSPVGLDPAIFSLEVQRLVHYAFRNIFRVNWPRVGARLRRRRAEAIRIKSPRIVSNHTVVASM